MSKKQQKIINCTASCSKCGREYLPGLTPACNCGDKHPSKEAIEEKQARYSPFEKDWIEATETIRQLRDKIAELESKEYDYKTGGKVLQAKMADLEIELNQVKASAGYKAFKELGLTMAKQIQELQALLEPIRIKGILMANGRVWDKIQEITGKEGK